MNRRTFVSVATAALASWRQAHAQGTPYKMGALFPLSGSTAELGNVFIRGTQLALAHIAQDKLLPRAIDLRTQDSQATPHGGAVGMSKLVNVDQVPYVLVAITGVAKAAAPIGDRQKVVMVNGGGVGPDLADLSPYFWNVIPLADQEIPPVIEWLKRERLKRVALIYIDDPLGQAVLKQLKGGLPAQGGELVAHFSVPPGVEQFAAISAKVRDAKPDAVYVASYGSQELQIIKQLRDNGVSQQLLSYSAASLASVVTLPESEGLVFTTQRSDWSATDRITKRFVDDWRAKHGGDPTGYAQNYYNATLLFAYLLASLEKRSKAGTDGDLLLAELKSLRHFALVGGDLSFTDKGTTVMPIQVNRINNARVSRIA